MGYDFIGWYTYPEGGAKAGDAGAPYTPSQAASPSTRGGSRATLIFNQSAPGRGNGRPVGLRPTHWSNPSVGGASFILVLSGSIGGPAICASGGSLTITGTGYLNAVTPPAGPPGGHWRRTRRVSSGNVRIEGGSHGRAEAIWDPGYGAGPAIGPGGGGAFGAFTGPDSGHTWPTGNTYEW
jgi:hypothetical protein